jgi:copper(I)-binding protein
MNRIALPLIALALAFATGIAQAQTVATDAWVRATVPGQQATGLFVDLKSPTAARLVGGSSPVAASVEVHEMRMDGGVMRMRALEALPLPAGQAVSLKPGSYHVMLMGLKTAVKAGNRVPVTLTIDRAGKTESLQLQAPVRAGTSAH